MIYVLTLERFHSAGLVSAFTLSITQATVSLLHSDLFGFNRAGLHG